MESRTYRTKSKEDADKVAGALKRNRIGGNDSYSFHHFEHSSVRLEYEGRGGILTVYIFSSCPEKVDIARSGLEDLAGVLLVELHPKRRDVRNPDDTRAVGENLGMR